MPGPENNLGVALTNCYFCGEGDRILMNMRLQPGYARMVREAHGKVLDMEPCQKCKGFMELGVILITIDEEKSGAGWNKPPTTEARVPTRHGSGRSTWMPNPYRTGGFFVVKDNAIRRIINIPEMAEWAIKHRWMFIEHKAAELVGLFQAKPTEESK